MLSIPTEYLLQLPLWVKTVLPLLVGLTYFICKGIYNVYFHPLSHVPGPKAWAFTQYVYTWHWLSERNPFHMNDLHTKYGPIVRVSPDQVSFNSGSSWKQIYGHGGGRKVFPKSQRFYTVEARPNTIVSEHDPKEHGKLRKPFASSFSAKSLHEIEPLVQGYVDLLVKQVGIEENMKKENDVVHWYNWCAFDIIGDLAFGDPFGCLREVKQHFWIDIILESVTASLWMESMVRHFGHNWVLTKLRSWVIPRRLLESREIHFEFSKDKIEKRLQKPVDSRKDFFSNVLAEEEGKRLTLETLTGQSSEMIIAGSETIATFLSSCTYFLLRTPQACKKLMTEIRETFNSYDEINVSSTGNLPYLNAVIQEGLRMYPPIPIGLPRVSPGETVDGVFIPEGYEVFTSPFAATHSESNFHRPYEFIPERWLDKECTDDKEASQPFVLGTRICLGRNLAMFEMRLILAKLLWTYDMELLDDTMDLYRDSSMSLLWKKPKIPVKFIKREGVVVPPLVGNGIV